mmetsp:Transcript_49675/g.57977  ORF Transcript_49675/g.57977 Transcript_49675/m.57977 type:complete len:91 (+) Transcript_49675:400-672(+)
MDECAIHSLRLFGITMGGPTNCFCANKIVVTNVSIPSSTLKKKHFYITYHKVRCDAAYHTSKGTNNLSGVLNKFLGPQSFGSYVQCIMLR